MTRFRKLIIEIHRRSVWQVLSVYLIGSWVALQVVESVGESAGLPDWVQPFAFVLLIIGLPIVLATAVVQEGMTAAGDGAEDPGVSPATPTTTTTASAGPTGGVEGPEEVPSGTSNGGSARDLFTWRNAIAGGVAAFALLGVAVAAYFVMWSTGIGPVGSLAAQGVFEEGDAVVLAEFENTSNDETLAEMVTEALRVDLAGSSIMTLVEPARIQDVLGRMGRDRGASLDPELAREVAIRDGFKAVIDGTVGSAGTGYIFVATLVAAEDGSVLATFRETADGPDEVIEAIDKLSQDIREKAGESLKVIKAEEPLQDVTTASLDALRKYTEAEKLADQAEYGRALTSLDEALELDPTFAMAYRKLAVILGNSGASLSRQVEAATRAYELRDRLTERERYLATAYYHSLVTGDTEAEIQAYRAVLDRFPNDLAANNNIGIALMDRGRLEEAVDAMVQAASGPSSSASALSNLPTYLALAGRPEEARAALARLETEYPQRRLWIGWNRVVVAAVQPDGPGTVAAADTFLGFPEAQGGWRAVGMAAKAAGFVEMGRIREARETLERARREMMEMGLWESVLWLTTVPPWVAELLERELSPAETVEIRTELGRVMDSIPPLGRGYEGAILSLAALGDREGVNEFLKRWRDDGTASSLGPSFEETRRTAEAFLLIDEDPERALGSLNQLSLSTNCPYCAIWQRGALALDLERLEEARDHFHTALTGADDDQLGVATTRVMVHRKLGQVYEALGDSAAAAEHFRIFADHWNDADPELQPWVRESRERAAALTGQPQ